MTDYATNITDTDNCPSFDETAHPQGLSADLQALEALLPPADCQPEPAFLTAAELEEMDLFRSREGLSEYHVGQLTRALSYRDNLAPLLVMNRGGRWFLIDGRHRKEAYGRAGKGSSIPVEVFTGSPSEAVLEGQQRNGSTTLMMTNEERQDGGWKLVKLGCFKTKQIMAAAGVSRPQVNIMRRALRDLGEDAHDFTRWRKALRAYKKKPEMTFTDDEVEAMNDSRAAKLADLMVKTMGMRPANDPELLARALEYYAGRRLLEVRRVLEERNRDDDGFDGLFETADF